MLHVKAFKANYHMEHVSFFSRDDHNYFVLSGRKCIGTIFYIEIFELYFQKREHCNANSEPY